MKVNYKANFKGYTPILRGIQLLLKDKTLTLAQFGAYICFVFQADFDNTHNNYRVILRDDNELAKEWGCNPVTVYRKRKQLIAKGLLTERNGLTEVTNLFLFELEWVRVFVKFPLPILQTLFTKPQDEIAKEEYFIAEMQKRQPQNSPQSSNISFKGDLGLSKKDKYDVITDEDLDEIAREIDAQKGGK